MTREVNSIREELRRTGLTARAIDAAWPEWWSREAESSSSAMTELRFTVARRLGLSPRSLFEGQPEFAWRDETKFKNLGAVTPEEATILSSFGQPIGTYLVQAVSERSRIPSESSVLRQAILESSSRVGLGELLSVCWGIGIPVIQLQLFPLRQKRMQAMAVKVGTRFAILLGRESRYAAQVAYIVAHELGHIASAHLRDSVALLDVTDPLQIDSSDTEETEADRYALGLLTGNEELRVEPESPRFNAPQLADAVIRRSSVEVVDPGVLALCLSHSTGHWRRGYAALKLMYPDAVTLGPQINALARSQMEWDSLSWDGREYLAKVMGLANAS